MSAELALKTTRHPKIFAKKIRRLIHAHPDQIKSICQQAGILNEDIAKAIDDVAEACIICARSGYPAPSTNISLNHVNEAFKMEVQLDFGFEIVRKQKRTILVITDTGTSFTGGLITASKSIDIISTCLESHWILRHGAPVSISADDEYNKGKLRSTLSTHNIDFKARPTRRYSKTVIVERKIQTVKGIIRKIDLEILSCSAEEVFSWAIFLFNFFSGSRLLSSFQLAHVY